MDLEDVEDFNNSIPVDYSANKAEVESPGTKKKKKYRLRNTRNPKKKKLKFI